MKAERINEHWMEIQTTSFYCSKLLAARGDGLNKGEVRHMEEMAKTSLAEFTCHVENKTPDFMAFRKSMNVFLYNLLNFKLDEVYTRSFKKRKREALNNETCKKINIEASTSNGLPSVIDITKNKKPFYEPPSFAISDIENGQIFPEPHEMEELLQNINVNEGMSKMELEISPHCDELKDKGKRGKFSNKR